MVACSPFWWGKDITSIGVRGEWRRADADDVVPYLEEPFLFKSHMTSSPLRAPVSILLLNTTHSEPRPSHQLQVTHLHGTRRRPYLNCPPSSHSLPRMRKKKGFETCTRVRTPPSLPCSSVKSSFNKGKEQTKKNPPCLSTCRYPLSSSALSLHP